jgi:hypothetical protein
MSLAKQKLDRRLCYLDAFEEWELVEVEKSQELIPVMGCARCRGLPHCVFDRAS